MTQARLRNAATFAAVLLAVGTAIAADASSTGSASPRTLAETKRSLERMPTAQSLAATPSGRSLSHAKREVGLASSSAAAAGPVAPSGIPLAKAKRL